MVHDQDVYLVEINLGGDLLWVVLERVCSYARR